MSTPSVTPAATPAVDKKECNCAITRASSACIGRVWNAIKDFFTVTLPNLVSALDNMCGGLGHKLVARFRKSEEAAPAASSSSSSRAAAAAAAPVTPSAQGTDGYVAAARKRFGF
jgi:hypothetical protein